MVRLEKNIQKYEKSIAKEQKKIDQLEIRLANNKLTRADFNIKKRQVEERINALNTRIRWYRGGMTKEKRHEEEKAEEKQKKLDEKEKKKERKEKKKDKEEESEE